MPNTIEDRCAAAHRDVRTACDSAPRSVKVIDVTGTEVYGCIRHAGDMLAVLEDGRVLLGPDGQHGDAIAAHYRARAIGATR